MEFSFKDTYRTAIEFLSDGMNTVMYDDQGNPNIMVCVPKYTLEDIYLSGGTHSAFLCEGKEVNEFWISKYQNTIGNGGVPISIADANPISQCSIEMARNGCRSKGRGWHQMTVFEYGAICALEHNRGGWIEGRLYRPGKEKSAVIGEACTAYMSTEHSVENDKEYNVHRSGTGAHAWAYEGSHGVYDLTGNTWDFCDGCRVQTRGGIIEFYGDADHEYANNFMSQKWVESWWAFDLSSAGKLYLDDIDVDARTKPDILSMTTGVFDFEQICAPGVDPENKPYANEINDMNFLKSVTLWKQSERGKQPVHDNTFTDASGSNIWEVHMGEQSDKRLYLCRGGRGYDNKITQAGEWTANFSITNDRVIIGSPRAVYIDI